mgnify:CR=1 FL=1
MDPTSPRHALDDPKPVQRWTRNPFYVLELPTDAPWCEIEHRADALRACLQRRHDTYPTPVGMRRRSVTDIEAAVDALRDPDARIIHELWASISWRSRSPSSPPNRSPRWSEAMTAFGWRSR